MAARPWLKSLRDRLSLSSARVACLPGTRSGFLRRHWISAPKKQPAIAFARRRPGSLRRTSTRGTACAAFIDTLEQRTLLSAVVQFGVGRLQILSDAGEDVTVRENPLLAGQLDVEIDGVLFADGQTLTTAQVTSIVISTGSGDNVIDLSGVTATAFANLTQISVVTGNGNDVITGSPDVANEVDAGDGDDLLTGGAMADSLDGGDGNDTLDGGLAADTLDGGDGDDVITGGGGDDDLRGGDGEDTLAGDDGNDRITAGDGRDRAQGGDGDDTINGNAGSDVLIGAGFASLDFASLPGGQTVTFVEIRSGTDVISVGLIDAELGSGTFVSSTQGVGSGAITILIELGDDGLAVTANGTDIATAVLADPAASAVVNVTVTGLDEFFAAAATAPLTFVSTGSNNDLLLGGGGGDLLLGSSGNDTLLGNGGDDTLLGRDGDDILHGHGGRDSIDGGTGDDSMNGGVGDDTLVGNDGDDTILGGAGDDLAIGDGTVITTSAFGNDWIRGQGGDDTLVGVFGRDTLSGGTGDDLIRSTLDVSNAVPPAPTPPPPIPTTNPPLVQALLPAVLSGGPLSPLVTPATLTTGAFDGDITIAGLDAAGEFGSGNEIFDPIRPIDPPVNDVIFDSDIYLRVGTTGTRTALSSFNSLIGSATELSSSFSNSALTIDLVQTVDVLDDFVGNRIGSQLTQTYSVTNASTTAVTYEFVRYNNAFMRLFPGVTNDGGGRIIGPNGVEIFFESTGLATPGATVSFVGITGIGGNPVPTNRFEFGPFASTFAAINSGGALSDSFNSGFGPADTDGDDIVDVPIFNAEVAVRNVFTLAPGATADYTTHTLFGTVTLAGSNMGPVAVADTATAFGGNPVTIDVVSNDVDTDGILDFSTVSIAAQPASGSVVSLGDGRVTYTPDPAFSGVVTFSYTIADNEGGVSNLAAVTVTVLGGDVVGDVIDGGVGRDTVIGDSGDDLISLGPDNDRVNAGRGNDTVFGGGGDDSIFGAEGDDSLVGQGGDDTLDGGLGEDILRWDGIGDGRDLVFGGDGADLAQVMLSSSANNVGIGQDALGRLTVREGRALLTIDNATVTQANINTGAGNDVVIIGDLDLIGTMRVVVQTGVGNDLIEARGSVIGSVRLEIFGEAGADTISGSGGRDRLFGGDGDDIIRGRSGADTIFGGAGADLIFGGAADDVVDGGDNDDTIFGGNGDDRLNGGLDGDQIEGGAGDDVLIGNLGDDLLNGMDGNDSILGGSGMDMMLGGSGRDTMDGGRNNDTILGNSGNDLIRGDHGDDRINGEEGDDEITGGDGNDTIFGADGDDGIAGNDGNDVIDGGQGRDTLRGHDGDDTLRGGGGRDTLVGDQGIDVLNGNGGIDLGVTGEALDPTPIRVETIDESFVLTSRMLENLDGV